MSGYCHREQCTEERSTALGEGERTAPAQFHERNRSVDHGRVADVANELEGGRWLQIVMEKKSSVQDL